MKKNSGEKCAVAVIFGGIGLAVSALIQPLSETLHLVIFVFSLLVLVISVIIIPGIWVVKAAFNIKSTAVAAVVLTVLLTLLLFLPGIIDAVFDMT